MDHARTAARPSAIVVLSAFFALSAVLAQAQVAPPILIEHDITNQSMSSDRFTWTDGGGHPRVAVLAHDNVGVPGAPGWPRVYGVAMREFQYWVNNAMRVANVTTYGNGGYGGFGYVVEHTGNPLNQCVGDDSPLGHWTTASFQRVFEGRHHVIFRYTQNYPRNCPNATTIPVTIDWIFSTGRDNPVYAITYDVASAAAADVLNDDSRAPYGELNIDGMGAANIDGVEWGDRYKFITTAASNLDVTSGWNYNTPNTVPFIQEWINGPVNNVDGSADATIGLVQTQTLDQQDAGGARDVNASPNGVDLRSLWTHTSGDMNGCGAQVMPCGDDWAYQAAGDTIQCCGPNNNARMTWKTMYGFVGQTTYNSNDVLGGPGATPPGYPKKSYSVYIVLGQQTNGPVEAQIAQVETVQSLTLSAVTGTVITTGPAGINDVTSVTYQPAGYNPIYGALAFAAAGNQLDANINVGAGTLVNPMIVISNYTSGDPVVKLAGTTLIADQDYFASVRSLGANELWLTLKANLTGATNHLEINPTGGVPAVPTGVVATATGPGSVDITWPAVPGASAYDLDRLTPGGWVLLATVALPGYGDVGVNSNTSYAYRVRAKNGFGTSASSIPDVATTMFFTDDPLIAGTTFVKAQHLQELRNVVDSVRNLAGLGAGVYTDVAAPDLAVKAVHVSELRSQLDEALVGIGIPGGGYTDPTLDSNVVVKAVHFQELRDRMQ